MLRRCDFLYYQVSFAAALSHEWMVVSSQTIAPTCVVQSCKRLRKLVLFFPNLSIQQWSHIFFVLTAILEVHVTPPAGLFFSNHVGNLRSVPRGLHGHARQLKNTSSSGVSRRVWKVTSQRCAWAYIIWWEGKAFSAV